jgi:hypothetical protein
MLTTLLACCCTALAGAAAGSSMMANPAGKSAQQAERAKFWAQFQETWQQVGAVASAGFAGRKHTQAHCDISVARQSITSRPPVTRRAGTAGTAVIAVVSCSASGLPAPRIAFSTPVICAMLNAFMLVLTPLHVQFVVLQVRQTQNVDHEPGSPSSGTNWTDITDARTFRQQ